MTSRIFLKDIGQHLTLYNYSKSQRDTCMCVHAYFIFLVELLQYDDVKSKNILLSIKNPVESMRNIL